MASKPNSSSVTAFLRAIPKKTSDWAIRNKLFIIAFFVPALVVYAAYILFKIYPFGDMSVLVLDLNAQYVYFYEGMRDAFWGKNHASPFYTWSGSLSENYWGIIAYYLASPFMLIVYLLPREMILGSILIMQLTKVGCCGVAFAYFLQKTKGIKPLNSLIFSTLYACMAYVVTQLMDPMWLDGPILLPLIMMGVEKLVDEKKTVGYIVPLGIMFFAHFYIGFMVGIFTIVYFFYYLSFGSDKKRAGYDTFNVFVRFGYCSLIAVLCAAFMLVPTYYALKLGKFDFTKPDYSFVLQFTPFDLLPKFLPSSYDTIRSHGLPDIYAGALTLLLLPLFFLNSKIPAKFKIGQLLLLVVLFFAMYIKPADMIMHGGQVPNWLPYRYSFIFSCVMLIMAAKAFEHIDGISKRDVMSTFAALVLLLFFLDKQKYEYVESMGTIWLTIACLASFVLMLHAVKDVPSSKLYPIMLVCLVSVELVLNANQTFQDIHKDVLYTKRSSYYPDINATRGVALELYKQDGGLYRTEKTYNRSSNDPVATNLRGMTHSTSIMNAKLLKFLGYMGYYNSTFSSRYAGYTPIGDSMLGFKYVLHKPTTGDRPPLSNYVYYSSKDGIDVYQNPNALSIGYMVDAGMRTASTFKTDNPFENLNNLLSTAVGNRGAYEYFTRFPTPTPELRNVTAEPSGDQTKYIKGTGDTTVDFIVTAPNTSPIFMFIPTNQQKEVNLWLHNGVDSNGNPTGAFDGAFKAMGQYFDKNYCIVELGRFAQGQKFNIRLTVKDDYTIFKQPLFYFLNEANYQADIGKLAENQWNITKWDADRIEGTINAQPGQMMMTSIPYEPGWTVYVDGKKTEPVTYYDSKGKKQTTDHIVIQEALIGIELEPGQHTVKMVFFPHGLTYGIVISLAGLAALAYIIHREHKASQKRVRVINKPVKAPPKTSTEEAKAELQKQISSHDIEDIDDIDDDDEQDDEE